MDTTKPIQRRHVGFSLAPDVVEHIRDNMRPGGPYADNGHAFECSIDGLRTEKQAVQDECKRLGVRFDEEAFWALYLDLRLASAPHKAGPRGPDAEPRRERMYGPVAEGLLSFADREVRSGRFVSTSQVAEVGFRRKMELQALGLLPAGLNERVAAYRAKVKA